MKKTSLTEENFQKLQIVMEEEKGEKGPLMPVLHEAQKIFGCIPLEVQKKICEEMKIPLSEIYGVITFYSQFSLEPKGDYVIGVCMGTACYVKGAQPILDKVSELIGAKAGCNSGDGRFSLVATRCIGACGLAPILTVNEDVYGRLKLTDIPGIVEKYQK
ncbi:NADH dehydrogenase (ubiquinone), 24 kDa subunit [Alkaliphilus metalliredigens QYMF]|uniref:NADH dehydrogenase (Ubiquinone), 24 kDa subunit n=1 Tax=Alkaliphilus metalliredigens (strain QYMF) TaxID=293826 RepID=A6TVG5_ALKMQ|nr:NAD(P)H-dependent oxidoreductase subunit E [Alkaliphilus metalliredigens]ABR50183.1 NADH dehydrogenase (ubiquinone), 24 kDa subunit [Alkaliphilus metalliredigens QYMF]